MEDRIPQRIADGIADVRLNRAAKMNALYPAMFWAIAELDVRHGDAKQTPDDSDARSPARQTGHPSRQDRIDRENKEGCLIYCPGDERSSPGFCKSK